MFLLAVFICWQLGAELIFACVAERAPAGTKRVQNKSPGTKMPGVGMQGNLLVGSGHLQDHSATDRVRVKQHTPPHVVCLELAD